MYIVVNSENDLNKLKQAQNNSNIFVWYYADWCGHCQMMKNEWEKLVSSKPSVNLAKVSDNFVKPEDNIQGYPTIKLYKNEKLAGGKNSGNIINYQGAREVDSFKKSRRMSRKKQRRMSRKKPRRVRRMSGRRPRRSRRIRRRISRR